MSPKVIIIEGCDNCGKDTLINKLKEHYTNSVVLHACAPQTNDLFTHYMNTFIHDTLEGYYNDNNAVINNRSMYGEYVYGPKYRNLPLANAVELIYKLETGQLKTFIKESDLYFILLSSTNADLLVNNDDGKSISNKKIDIIDEIEKFNEIFNMSHIKNKKRILVNNGSSFRTQDAIYNDVINFIEG